MTIIEFKSLFSKKYTSKDIKHQVQNKLYKFKTYEKHCLEYQKEL